MEPALCLFTHISTDLQYIHLVPAFIKLNTLNIQQTGGRKITCSLFHEPWSPLFPALSDPIAQEHFTKIIEYYCGSSTCCLLRKCMDSFFLF